MKNFLADYKKEKKIWTFTIIWLSLILAISINFYIFDRSSLWQNIKASILDINNVWNKWDFYLEKAWNTELQIKSSKLLQKPTTLSFTINYNPEVLEIDRVFSNLWLIEYLWEQNIWSDTIMITTDQTKDINPEENILEIYYSKKEDESTQINITNANFIDIENQQYILTTQWLTF